MQVQDKQLLKNRKAKKSENDELGRKEGQKEIEGQSSQSCSIDAADDLLKLLEEMDSSEINQSQTSPKSDS